MTASATSDDPPRGRERPLSALFDGEGSLDVPGPLPTVGLICIPRCGFTEPAGRTCRSDPFRSTLLMRTKGDSEPESWMAGSSAASTSLFIRFQCLKMLREAYA